MKRQKRSAHVFFSKVIIFLFFSLQTAFANDTNTVETVENKYSPQHFNTSRFKVKTVSSQAIGSGYLQVEAIMRGKLKRNDGSFGSYKVPITLMYPEDNQQCNGLAIQDVVNSVFYETFETVGTAHDPLFPSLFPFGRLILGDSFIKNNGYVYGLAQWNKLVIERQRSAGTLADTSFKIERASDAYSIIRDLSAFLRKPKRFLINNLIPKPCAADNVIGFGYSQTGMLLRQFYFEEQNSKMANSIIFDEGLVFEGAIHAVPGGHCRSSSMDYPFYSYSFDNCDGATPASQGKVMTINAETDVQFSGGWLARSNEEKHHYKVYEIAGASHIPTTLFDLKIFGIRPEDQATQNYANIGFVYRAMVVNMNNWILNAEEPPESAILQGSTKFMHAPLFSSSSWGSDQEEVFIFSLGEDGNALGGVRLPHLRTTTSDNSQVGASLGIYRGTACYNDPSSSDFILNCQLRTDPAIYNISAGTFHPYTEINPDLCSYFYPDGESYMSSVRNGAEYALANRWLLAEEMESMIDDVTDKALEFPGCVPTM